MKSYRYKELSARMSFVVACWLVATVIYPGPACV